MILADVDVTAPFAGGCRRTPCPQLKPQSAPSAARQGSPTVGELIITRGVPAAGKTAWARAWLGERPTRRTRVNRGQLWAHAHGYQVTVQDFPVALDVALARNEATGSTVPPQVIVHLYEEHTDQGTHPSPDVSSDTPIRT